MTKEIRRKAQKPRFSRDFERNDWKLEKLEGSVFDVSRAFRVLKITWKARRTYGPESHIRTRPSSLQTAHALLRDREVIGSRLILLVDRTAETSIRSMSSPAGNATAKSPTSMNTIVVCTAPVRVPLTWNPWRETATRARRFLRQIREVFNFFFFYNSLIY